MIASKDIRLVPIKKVKINPKNRNKHHADQIERLVKIIEYQGFRNPLIISNRTGLVVAGHGRLSAAKKMKLKEVPVMFQDFENEAQEYACMVSDNAIASWSELDLSSINNDISDLGPDFDIDLLGIKGFEIEVADKEPGCDEDEVPEHVEPKTKLGDIYQLGRHRLMCGDSTSIDAVERLMNGEKADMVFTDPPYGINLSTKYSSDSVAKLGDGRKQRRNDYRAIEGDDEPFDPNLILGLFDYVKEMFLWGANYYMPQHPKGSWLCWDKKVTESGDRQVMGDFELAWSKNKHKNKIFRVTWFGPFGHKKKTDGDKRVHPTQKPVKLIEAVFQAWAEGLTLVTDLFGGSGSTLIACEKTNRKCFMMELDPHYCDVIISRFEKYSGKKAELVGQSNQKAELINGPA